jgi:hypothetical protein
MALKVHYELVDASMIQLVIRMIVLVLIHSLAASWHRVKMTDRQGTISMFFRRKAASSTVTSSASSSNSTENGQNVLLGLPQSEHHPDVAEVNAHVRKNQLSKTGKKRGPYSNFAPDFKAEVGRYAAEHGNTKAVEHFSKLGRNIKESTVRRFKEAYFLKLKENKGDKSKVVQLNSKSRGRPLILGEEVDKNVRDYVKQLRYEKMQFLWTGSNLNFHSSFRVAGGIVNKTVVISAAKGFIMAQTPSLLKENGGHLVIDEPWATSFLRRMGFVQRKATKAARKLPTDFDAVKSEFLRKVVDCVKEHDIPADLVVNIDQTGVKLIPISEWTMDQKGKRQISVLGLEDKREITALLGISLGNKLLPPQVIYAGKTHKCHPQISFPPEWNVTHSPSHWSTTSTMIEYVDAVLCPFFSLQKKNLGLGESQKSLLILDVFASHRTPEFLQKLEESNIKVAFIPPGCTGELQPLDVGFNNDFKKCLKSRFTSWYAAEVADQVAKGVPACEVRVGVAMSVVKPLHARWLIDTTKEIQHRESTINKAWQGSGIAGAITSATTTSNCAILDE